MPSQYAQNVIDGGTRVIAAELNRLQRKIHKAQEMISYDEKISAVLLG